MGRKGSYALLVRLKVVECAFWSRGICMVFCFREEDGKLESRIHIDGDI